MEVKKPGTTFNNKGYETYVKINEIEQEIKNILNDSEITINDIKFKLSASSVNDKEVNVVYTLTNETSESKTYSVASTSDVYLANNDKAAIYKTGHEKLQITQDNIAKNTTYATQLTIKFNPQAQTTWIGRYSKRKDNKYIDGEETEFTCEDNVDTGMAYSWSGILEAGETKSFTAIFTLQEAEESVVNFYRYGETEPCETKNVLVGGSVKTLSVTEGDEYVREWNTKKDGTGKYYLANKTVIVDSAEINLYEIKYDTTHKLETKLDDNAIITSEAKENVDHRKSVSYTIEPKDGYRILSVKVNGVEMVDELVDNVLTLNDVTCDIKIDVTSTFKYDVIEGANQSYTKNSENVVEFKMNADSSLFDGNVYIDDVLVDSSNYTNDSENATIIFNKDYLNTLEVGKHTLKVIFSDKGIAMTTFTIEEDKTKTTIEINNVETNTTETISNPKTGDSVMYVIVGLVISLIGAYVTKKNFIK